MALSGSSVKTVAVGKSRFVLSEMIEALNRADCKLSRVKSMSKSSKFKGVSGNVSTKSRGGGAGTGALVGGVTGRLVGRVKGSLVGRGVGETGGLVGRGARVGRGVGSTGGLVGCGALVGRGVGTTGASVGGGA